MEEDDLRKRETRQTILARIYQIYRGERSLGILNSVLLVLKIIVAAIFLCILMRISLIVVSLNLSCYCMFLVLYLTELWTYFLSQFGFDMGNKRRTILARKSRDPRTKKEKLIDVKINKLNVILSLLNWILQISMINCCS